MSKLYNTIITTLFAIVFLPVAVSAQVGEVKQSKRVQDNEDGTYTVTLETYVTGQMTKQPLDIILLLDNSNSMYSYHMKNWYEDKNGDGKVDKNGDLRIDGLRSAVISFLNYIYGADSPDHRIAVLKFNGGGRRIDKYLIDEQHPITEERLNSHVQNLMGEGVWVSNNSGQISTLKKKINNENGSGDALQLKQYSETGTPAAEAFVKAKNMFMADGIRDDGRAKIVIFITDGCCGTGEIWGATLSGYSTTGYEADTVIPNRYYASTVIEQANALKDIATIYSVGTFGDFYWSADGKTHYDQSTGDVQKSDTYYYLRHVSSKYTKNIRVDGNLRDTPASGTACKTSQLPTPTGTIYDYTNAFVSVDSGDKSMTISAGEKVFDSTSGEDLAEDFEEIAGEVIKAAELGASSTVALDAMTNQFVFLDGIYTEPGSIHLYTCSAKNQSDFAWATTGTAVAGARTVYKDSNNYLISSTGDVDHVEYWVPWEPWTSTDPITNYIRINPAISVTGKSLKSDHLEVTGFDYKTNFVGLGTGGKYQGMKLIIQFDIKAAPSNKGGLNVTTNDPVSGVYNKPEGSKGSHNCVILYDMQRVNLPYLKIVKKGLSVGESAVFKVTKVDSDGNAITGEGAYNATVMVSKADALNDAVAILKLIYSGRYKVEELSWSGLGYDATYYDSDNDGVVDTKGKYNIQSMSTLGSPARELVYTFGNVAVTTRPEHAEAYKPNNMGVTKSVSMSFDDSGTTPASGTPVDNPNQVEF